MHDLRANADIQGGDKNIHFLDATAKATLKENTLEDM